VNAKSALFWCLIASLFGASVYFGANAEAQRRELQRQAGKLHTGDQVTISSVVDGDTVVVQREDGSSVAVRILGIKAFDASRDKDAAARFGKAAMDALARLSDGRSLSVELNEPATDKYGRTLARLNLGDEPLGAMLVARGLALVYTAYPFDHMPDYLSLQEEARAARQGLWSDPEVAKQADLLDREWRRQAR
jgi:endonuclease YncB( thermonuclease family)